MDTRIEEIREAAEYLKKRLGDFKPQIGIILGSGLGKLGEKIEAEGVIPYTEIPNFVRSTAIGHKGNFIYGRLGGKNVVAMQGRFHYYEGYPMEKVTLPVRAMSQLGIEVIFVSNAAGGINRDFKIGDLMVIDDHINLMPNPLMGSNIDELGVRFPDMSCAYDRDLIARAEQIAAELGITLKKGVYLANSGPSYETPAEIRFYSSIGADAVGMSTVPEVIAARHCDVKVFGMSIITNEANFKVCENKPNNGADVVRIADAAADKMSLIFEKLIASI